MIIKEYTEKWKKELFDGYSLNKRYFNFLDILTALKEKTNKITQQDQDALIDMVVSNDRPSINQYLSFMAKAWIEEMFDIIVMPQKAATEDSVNEQIEYDDEYDPEMLMIAGEHPEAWSKEAVKQEIKEHYRSKKNESS